MADDLIERHGVVTVTTPAPQAAGQRGQELATPGAQKIVLGICARESGIRHRGVTADGRWPLISG
jgi:hypothetical protein